MSFTVENHYVPRWYQKRFIPTGIKEQKYHYLDLTPERINHPNGGFHYRDEMRCLGPTSCFFQPHLYTLFFSEYASDIIEERFFGNIDRIGNTAVDFFANYQIDKFAGEEINNLLRYMDAQKLRTPKGLDFLKAVAKDGSHQASLYAMRDIWQINVTIWMEGVWEVLHCDDSDTKFIVTDHPITTYNKELFPGSKTCKYPFDAPIELLGTHTLFPLDLNRCLVITNLGYVRNPWVNLLKRRENPRYFAQTIKDIRKIQTGRQISENDVRAINYILKSRAKRYIAAVQKEWLYPEKFLKSTMWNKLGDRFFLMPDPRKVTFSSGIFIGNNDGSSWNIDEYGRPVRDDDPKVKSLRDAEWDTFHRAKQAWYERYGQLSRDDLMRYF